MRSVMLLVALGLSASVAFGATLQPQQGKIELNGRSISGPQSVSGGDIVTAGSGASAKIVYADGCTLNVDPGTTIKVPATSTCKFGDADFLLGAGLIAGATAGIIVLTQDDDHSASP